ncbi:MAG: hypothetical protein JWN34_2861 [Bryobacterales bacterium]|nr:hypothetical protein [Bryobacterales bacterium]
MTRAERLSKIRAMSPEDHVHMFIDLLGVLPEQDPLRHRIQRFFEDLDDLRFDPKALAELSDGDFDAWEAHATSVLKGEREEIALVARKRIQ